VENGINFMVIDSPFNIVVAFQTAINHAYLIYDAASHKFTLWVCVGNKCDRVCATLG
jgi:hypothetical protein